MTKPSSRLADRMTTAEIVKDLHSLPADISKLEWVLASDHDTALARIKRLEGELEKMPQIMHEELLQTTAWMGIPEKKRQKCIEEQVSNIEFIVRAALSEDEDDPTPWCSRGHKTRQACDCEPSAWNE